MKRNPKTHTQICLYLILFTILTTINTQILTPDIPGSCTAYCTKCTVEKGCYGCGPGYYLAGKNYCIKVKSTIANCSLYITDGECLECSSGFGLENGQCVLCIDENCHTCLNGSANKCVICNNGLKPSSASGGTCTGAAIAGCINASYTTCLKCSEGFSWFTSSETCATECIEHCEVCMNISGKLFVFFQNKKR